MKTQIKLVVSDIDGTLVSHARHEVSALVREAVIAVENKGVIMAAVSGRPYVLAKATLNVLGVEGPCVMDGGATIVDSRTDKNIWKQWIDIKTTKSIVEKIMPYSIAIAYTEGNKLIDTPLIDIDTIIVETPAIFALIDKEKETELRSVMASFEDVDFYILDGVHPDTYEPHRAIQITHHLATKHHGVEALRKMLNIPMEETLAIGDGDNDIALFRSAAIKVAMGNATEGLKQKADFVTGSLQEDGFAQAMNKFIL